MLITLIAGARPNFVKIAPLIAAIHKYKAEGADIQYRLVHTGQHYDDKMSADFFSELNIPHPDINLECGGGTQAEQTAAIMVKFEAELRNFKPDVVLVVGDVTSTLACSITAKKMQVSVVHVEAGIRSYDISMPEEINRMVTDAISDHFFTTTEMAGDNLRKAGITDDRIHFAGNTMIDTLLKQQPNFQQPAIWKEAGLDTKGYFMLTLHRPANVDDGSNLRSLLETIIKGSRGLPIIFPVHPRTEKILNELGITAPYMVLTKPMSYLNFNYLVMHAKAVITDSGGITEETTVMNVPCMTLRDNTERPETISVGTNELIGTDPANLPPAFEKLFAGQWKKGGIPELWDGKTSERIIAKIIGLYGG